MFHSDSNHYTLFSVSFSRQMFSISIMGGMWWCFASQSTKEADLCSLMEHQGSASNLLVPRSRRAQGQAAFVSVFLKGLPEVRCSK